jgi:TrpR-related protein YerC/YecD
MSYTSKYASKDIDGLFDAILKLKTREECYRFFEDLCTVKEVQDMAQRLRVAIMLDHKISYQIISAETHASTATISRVNKALVYGADGYKLILQKMASTVSHP